MKQVARAVAALAFLAFAAPALPCEGMEKSKTVKADSKKSAVAKSGQAEKKGAAPEKSSGEARPASATN